jgi:PAS domain S-box-containing protein
LNGKERIGELRLVVSLDDLEEQLYESRRTTASFSILVFVVGLGAVVVISVLLTSPLSRIAATAKAISSGELTRRADITSGDEVGELAVAFNEMVDSVASARDEMEALNRSLETKVEQRTAEVRREAEERKQIAREMRLLLESTYDGILAIDSDGRCTLINTVAAAGLGSTEAQSRGRDGHKVLHGESCAIETCTLAGALVHPHRRSLTTSLLRSNGTTMLADVSIAPVFDERRRTGAVITFRDISEQESLRAQLADAERLSGLGRLAAMMAHEFNNVLMGIQPFVEIIAHATRGNETVANASRSISQSVKRGKRVTEEVLRYTRPREPQIVRLEAGEWLKEFGGVMRASLPPGIELVIQPPDRPMVFGADREQVEQVFANLVSNARDAMPDGGTITIRVHAYGALLEFEVHDTGIGIAAHAIPLIFEPFFTTKPIGGTGLGLSVAAQIVSRHDGSIDVESQPGAGTTFRIRLPLGEGASAAPAGPPVQGSPGDRRVLLVDDDELVAAGISELLMMSGHTLFVAHDGTAALAVVDQFDPEVAVLDLGLPGMSGTELFERLRENLPGLPVIFSTGHGDATQLSAYLSQPNVAFLQKPYAIERLLDKIAAISQRRPRG